MHVPNILIFNTISFVRRYKREVELQYCKSSHMPADVLTKALTRDTHLKCLARMGLNLKDQSMSC